MTDKDIEKLLKDFGQTLNNDDKAIGIAIALSSKDSKNVALSCCASPFELGYMLSKAVETIMGTFDNPEDIDDFSRGLVETMQFLNAKKRKKSKYSH